MKIAQYETSLSDAQWALVQPLLPKPSKRGRPLTDRRLVLDAILYIVKGGIPWRLLPLGFPPWKTVHSIFRKWTLDHTWEDLNDRLRALVRAQQGKRCRPTAAVLDSQSVKSDGHGGTVGYDAAKKIKGRKRHLLVDTLGLVLGVAVTRPTSRAGRSPRPLSRVLGWFPWLRRMWVDGGYTGPDFAQWVRGLRLEAGSGGRQTLRRCDRLQVLPRRWVVERTFGWMMRHRRLVHDYEHCETSAESWVYIAMIRIQLRRLA